jgi:hypothetical protein
MLKLEKQSLISSETKNDKVTVDARLGDQPHGTRGMLSCQQTRCRYAGLEGRSQKLPTVLCIGNCANYIWVRLITSWLRKGLNLGALPQLEHWPVLASGS